MQLFVKTTGGKTVTVDVPSLDTTVAELKRQIEIKSGIPINKQQLVFCGKRMGAPISREETPRFTGLTCVQMASDDRTPSREALEQATLYSYGVYNQATIHVVVKAAAPDAYVVGTHPSPDDTSVSANVTIEFDLGSSDPECESYLPRAELIRGAITVYELQETAPGDGEWTFLKTDTGSNIVVHGDIKPVDGTVAWDPDRRIVRFTPHTRLNPDTHYCARLEGAARNSMPASYFVPFKTSHKLTLELAPSLEAALQIAQACGVQSWLEPQGGMDQLIAQARASVRATRKSGAIDLEAASARLNADLIQIAFGKERCVICFEKSADFACLPCKHQCACEACIIKCMSCPICRVEIQTRLDVTSIVKAGRPYDRNGS